MAMKSRLVVMLTNHDVTVPNAQETFESAKDIEQVKYWGFKNVGLPKDQMRALVQSMKAAGKTTFLEVVTYTEEECMDGARTAVECGFDYLCGTLFYESVWEYLKDKNIGYQPFLGKVYGSPSVLEGSMQQIIDQGNSLIAKGIQGFDLLAYRYTGDPEQLAEECVKALGADILIAGSIDSKARLEKVNEIDPWGFTIGGALFNGKFVKGGSFRKNLEEVVRIMAEID